MRVHEEWLLTPQRAAVHLPTATAVIADLHLGYNEARRRGGEAVPCGNLEMLLLPLGQVLSAHAVRRLVIAGDLFEATYCDSLTGELLRWLQSARVELVGVIPGNHDRGMTQQAVQMPLFTDGFCLGGWHVVHGDGNLPRTKLIHGHFHPCVRLGSQIASPCYLIGRTRILLPAYSADARGVNVLGVRTWQGHRCCIPVGNDVLDFGKVAALRRAGRSGSKCK